jgi:hypothetical protein
MMPRWLHRMFGRRPPPEPLKGRRDVRRLKFYTALSGYVYEYVYDGYRDDAGAREHVFQVSGDRKTWFALSVFVPAAALDTWERRHQRSLNEAERYAVAKMALFAAFDERDTPADLRAPVHITVEQVESVLDALGV